MKQDTKIDAIGIIPARYGSTRLPGKPLLDICGKPLIQRVWDSVQSSKLLRKIVIATDHEDIFEKCKSFGAECIMTPQDMPSGTDRTAYATTQINDKANIIVNIQGDEPLLEGNLIDKLVECLSTSQADVATLIKPIKIEEELFDSSVVKAVIDHKNFAMYFSRCPIPFVRDYKKGKWMDKSKFYKHIGIYAYKREALFKFVSLPQSMLEQTERLEQLRLMENGGKYYCLITAAELYGVDTLIDLDRVIKIFENRY